MKYTNTVDPSRICYLRSIVIFCGNAVACQTLSFSCHRLRERCHQLSIEIEQLTLDMSFHAPLCPVLVFPWNVTKITVTPKSKLSDILEHMKLWLTIWIFDFVIFTTHDIYGLSAWFYWENNREIYSTYLQMRWQRNGSSFNQLQRKPLLTFTVVIIFVY